MLSRLHIPSLVVNCYLIIGSAYLVADNFVRLEQAASRMLFPDPCVIDPMKCIIKLVKTNSSSDAKTWTLQGQKDGLSFCPRISPYLEGVVRVNVKPEKFSVIAKRYPMMSPGGKWSPSDCHARHKVAIIVPYRDRESHLKVLLNNMHSFLQKQQLDYVIVIVEQVEKQTINRAKLMNVGYLEARKLYPFDCFIFSDVDLVPEDDRNLYACPVQPRHMSIAVDKFGYKLPYPEIFGGIVALTVDQMETLNGFSNAFWGWGGEDDDMSLRLKYVGFNITRYPHHVAKYKMLKHRADKGNPVNPCRNLILKQSKERWQSSGIRSMNGTYEVIQTDLFPLYTRVLVDLKEEQSKKELNIPELCSQ